MDDARLNRIEEKLDKLTEVVANIARVEEKILASQQRQDRTEIRVDHLEKQMENIKTHSDISKHRWSTNDKVYGLVLAAFFSTAIAFIFKVL